MSSLTVGYAYDPALQESANALGRNYWYVYIREILSRLGVAARRVPLHECAEPAVLADLGVLFLGDFPAAAVSKDMAAAGRDWVNGGGTLIGFATEGLDEVFGVAGAGMIEQTPDAFSISAYLELRPSPVTLDCRADTDPEQKLIVISPVRLLRCEGSAELAHLYLPDPCRMADGSLATDAHAPAIVRRDAGCGHTFYFAFNVAQTMWLLQQGRPIDRDYDGDGYLRLSDACTIGDNSCAVPYADALHFLLMSMIGHRPVPMIHQIPPRDGKVAPALLFFGGDDEGQPENQVRASDFMASRGLPYHINCMPDRDGTFAFTEKEQRQIEANGHELALHYDFITDFEHPSAFTEQDVQRQAAMFRERFGRDSVCAVKHWCRWTGWAEPARWRAAAGEKADNSRIHWTSPPLNPVNLVGFAFGTAYPYHFWDDAQHANERIDFLSLPIVAYEVGYQGEDFCPEKVRAALEFATRYHLTCNFFYHPTYLARYPTCNQAVDELLRLIGDMPVGPVLMGPDALVHWWQARASARVEEAVQAGAAIRFEAACEYQHGFVVKLALGEGTARCCLVDGTKAACETAHEFGRNWLFIPLAAGSHRVEVRL